MQFEYRTKPIRVEAVQWHCSMSYEYQPHWLWGAIDNTHNRTHGKVVRVGDRLQVVTANGTQMADDGDWIVFFTSTTSELRVYKDDEFRRTFDRDERRPRLRSVRVKDERQK
jgi:hypothetical protein